MATYSFCRTSHSPFWRPERRQNVRARVWNPASFTCSLSHSKPQYFSGPVCNLSCANDKKYKNIKYGSIPLYRHYWPPRIQSMNSMCSLHHAGNTIFTLFIWTIVVDKQGLKTYMMSVNNPRTLALESILKTLKEFLVRPYKRASYRNLPQLKYSKYINNRKPTNQPTEPPPSKSTYLVHAT